LIAPSIKMLPYETPGGTINKEAKQLFLPMEDEYALAKWTKPAKAISLDFAAHVTTRCSFEFMPIEGRVYFMRNSDGGP
jgi:hypothetical protein